MIASLSLIGTQTFAQDMQASAGLELGVPFVSYGTVMTGVTGGFEYVILDKLTLTGQLGFEIMFTNDNVIDDYYYYDSNIPIVIFQVGTKYYFTEALKGFYGHGQIGIHTRIMKYVTNTIDDDSFTRYTRAGISGALGVGYQTERLDFGLRFNGVTGSTSKVVYANNSFNPGSGFGYVGVRIAYLIPVGN